MYSVVYPESDFGIFSGMVPERFRNPNWSIFRNGSGMVPEEFHVSPEDIFAENPIPSALNAKTVVALSVVLNSYFGRPFKCLVAYVGFLHNIFLGLPENIRMSSGERYRTESISVVVVTIWLRVMT